MIDVHVHLRDGKQAAKETIAHGLRVGALCGIKAFFDMPNTDPPLTSQEPLLARIAYGRKVARMIGKDLFYGVYGGVTADADLVTGLAQLYRVNRNLVGMKMFAGHSTGNMGLTAIDAQLQVYRTLASCGYEGLLAVHCEKESLLRPDLWNPAKPESHTLARPAQAEVASVADQITFARESGFAGTLHICHISTAGAIDLVARARATGMRITCGATAHHALLDDSVATVPGNLMKMNPPLRSASDRRAIFDALLDGSVDWIESDHAPHTLADKEAGASGIPGFAGTLLLIRELRRSGVTENRLRSLCGARANEVYGLDLPITILGDEQIERQLVPVRSSYPWDPFSMIV